jgi:hypothetical protein
MKVQELERDFHMKAVIWNFNLQWAEERLACTNRKLEKSSLNLDLLDTKEELKKLNKKADHYQKRIKALKNRISVFENKRSLLNECNTLLCDSVFFEEAKTINIQTKGCVKNIKILTSNKRYFCDSKILN